MKKTLLLLFLAVFSFLLHAEDWTTANGRTTYKNVKVLSHDDAYVTILDDDGGGRVALSTLAPDLQKRFAYDPAKAAACIAATAATDERDKAAIAAERAQAQQALQKNAAPAPVSKPMPPVTTTPAATPTPATAQSHPAPVSSGPGLQFTPAKMQDMFGKPMSSEVSWGAGHTVDGRHYERDDALIYLEPNDAVIVFTRQTPFSSVEVPDQLKPLTDEPWQQLDAHTWALPNVGEKAIWDGEGKITVGPMNSL